MWKLCHNRLPSNKILAQKKIIPENYCPRCNTEVETNLHCIFFCKNISHIWFASSLGFKPCLWNHQVFSLKNIFKNLSHICVKEDLKDKLALFCSIAYFIWVDRNSVVFQKTRPKSAQQVLLQATSSLLLNPHTHFPLEHFTYTIPKGFTNPLFLISDGGFNLSLSAASISYGYLGLNGDFKPLFFGTGRSTWSSAEEADFFWDSSSSFRSFEGRFFECNYYFK